MHLELSTGYFENVLEVSKQVAEAVRSSLLWRVSGTIGKGDDGVVCVILGDACITDYHI